MSVAKAVFRSAGTAPWTPERLERLDRTELKQLMANAERLGASALVTSCAELLRGRPGRDAPDPKQALDKGAKRLVPRNRGFNARGVWLADPRTSWSGVRKTDGVVVMALWHAAIVSRAGTCSCLLWAPNTGGPRAWSDSAAGQERRTHCELVRRGAAAEGLLVHGVSLPDRLPEDRARTVLGIDPEAVVRFSVERRGDEYWATWGRAS